MISFDFEYYKPTSVHEAVSLFHNLKKLEKEAIYYGGGTEFISRARRDEIKVDAVIDIKGIPICSEFGLQKDKFIIGAGVTLTTITDSNQFPLLSNVSRLIATRTERNKITIGGNIVSHLFYREAILPFLLADSKVVIASKDGVRELNINKLVKREENLEKDAFIVQIVTDKKYTQYLHYNSRKTKHSRVNYPIASIAAMQVDDEIRIAFSGVCEYPFRMKQIEEELNQREKSIEKRIDRMFKHIPEPIIHDLQASADYRKFIVENEVSKLVKKIEGVS